jgi:hypothetical protein
MACGVILVELRGDTRAVHLFNDVKGYTKFDVKLQDDCA